MYLQDTFFNKKFGILLFGATNSLPAFWYSRHPFFSSLSSSNNPPCDPDTITRRLPKQQVAAVRPRCTGRDFDAIFRTAWLILPWTSQAACGSSQTFHHPFSRYYMSCAWLSKCVICKTVIHTDLWNWLCFVLWEARTLFAPKSVRQGRIPFCCYGVRASPRQFQRGHRALH
jgi:hypothetical protein